MENNPHGVQHHGRGQVETISAPLPNTSQGESPSLGNPTRGCTTGGLFARYPQCRTSEEMVPSSPRARSGVPAACPGRGFDPHNGSLFAGGGMQTCIPGWCTIKLGPRPQSRDESGRTHQHPLSVQFHWRLYSLGPYQNQGIVPSEKRKVNARSRSLPGTQQIGREGFPSYRCRRLPLTGIELRGEKGGCAEN